MKQIFTLLFAGLVFAGGWWDGEEALLPPNERIEGTWTINQITAFGIIINDGLGTVDFNSCDQNDCTIIFTIPGVEQDKFTYVLDQAGKQLIIENGNHGQGDSDYSGTYSVTEFTNNSLKISTETILGNLDYEMSK